MYKTCIAINGLGRIGKNVLRSYFENKNLEFDIVAINLGERNIDSKLHTLEYDSVHGHFSGIESINKDYMTINGKKINLIKENNIENIDWKSHNVDIVLECTGQFNTKELSIKHINSGAKKVIVSAPCKNSDKNIVYGVNHQNIDKNDIIISAASCTTNCIAPIAKILDDTLGIESGFITTIHSYTADQNLVDSSHKDLRRARAAAMSIIPTKTGAANSINTILPNLSNKLSAAAIRVPTPNVSMIDFSFLSKTKTSKTELNKLIKKEIQNQYREIVSFTELKLVSIDFNHTKESAIFDSTQTEVINQNFCRVVAWYDNEWGFSQRLLDLTKILAHQI